jgi:hypothetical protein
MSGTNDTDNMQSDSENGDVTTLSSDVIDHHVTSFDDINDIFEHRKLSAVTYLRYWDYIHRSPSWTIEWDAGWQVAITRFDTDPQVYRDYVTTITDSNQQAIRLSDEVHQLAATINMYQDVIDIFQTVANHPSTVLLEILMTNAIVTSAVTIEYLEILQNNTRRINDFMDALGDTDDDDDEEFFGWYDRDLLASIFNNAYAVKILVVPVLQRTYIGMANLILSAPTLNDLHMLVRVLAQNHYFLTPKSLYLIHDAFTSTRELLNVQEWISALEPIVGSE